MADINAGVVVVTKFVSAESATFSGYIDYISRTEAVRNGNTNKYVIGDLKEAIQEYNHYMDYMDDPEKTSELFTADQDNLTLEQKNQLKDVFETAQSNNSLMWQTVISFDNRWLAENGLFDKETAMLDERKVKECARGCMNKILTKENLLDSSVWSGGIHYNTDNIHVHIATVDLNGDVTVRGNIYGDGFIPLFTSSIAGVDIIARDGTHSGSAGVAIKAVNVTVNDGFIHGGSSWDAGCNSGDAIVASGNVTAIGTIKQLSQAEFHTTLIQSGNDGAVVGVPVRFTEDASAPQRTLFAKGAELLGCDRAKTNNSAGFNGAAAPYTFYMQEKDVAVIDGCRIG